LNLMKNTKNNIKIQLYKFKSFKILNLKYLKNHKYLYF